MSRYALSFPRSEAGQEFAVGLRNEAQRREHVTR
jgi:hypothetical protein